MVLKLAWVWRGAEAHKKDIQMAGGVPTLIEMCRSTCLKHETTKLDGECESGAAQASKQAGIRGRIVLLGVYLSRNGFRQYSVFRPQPSHVRHRHMCDGGTRGGVPPLPPSSCLPPVAWLPRQPVWAVDGCACQSVGTAKTLAAPPDPGHQDLSF